MECASHYTNKILSQGSIYNSQKSLYPKPLQVWQTACLLGAGGGNKAETAYLVALQAAKFSPAAHPAITGTGAVPSMQ